MSDKLSLFASTQKHLESLLATELESLGAADIREVGSGVQFSGSLETAYKACLWSRVANRILLPLTAKKAADPDALYAAVRTIDWSQHLREDQTLAVDFFCAKSSITHSQYGALKVKDAIVDQFREATGVRPSVDRSEPDLRINVYLFRDRARIAIDLSGTSLHRRNYRLSQSRAPLKENLAASLLLKAGWPALAARSKPLHDPMCGSGTFVIEAAMIAGDIAPGLKRDYFGFLGWKGHRAEMWETILEQARARAAAGVNNIPPISGSDISAASISVAQENVERAGLSSNITLSCEDIADLSAPSDQLEKGLVICNPPYGVRLEQSQGIGKLYATLGAMLTKSYPGWRLGIFSGAPDLLYRARLELDTQLSVENGGIACKFFSGTIEAKKNTANADPVDYSQAGTNAGAQEVAVADVHALEDRVSSGVESDEAKATSPWMQAEERRGTASVDSMFVNRIAKNVRKLRGWIKQQEISAYRIYDADIPEYAVAVDVYDGVERHVVVQEYRPPSTVDAHRAAERRTHVLQALPAALNCPPGNIHQKLRQRQKGNEQYQRVSVERREHLIEEQGCAYLLNFDDYLDVGVFPDHRKIRRFIRDNSNGKRFLNLYGYTGVATVYAGVGGAKSSVTVDLSNNYTAWCRRNLVINGLKSEDHQVIKADVESWLGQMPKHELECFDLILLDPPTFSNSTSMEGHWDVQRDHLKMITDVMGLLSADGLLIFSNNFRRFRLDDALPKLFDVENRSKWSTDRDFERHGKDRHCWFVRHRQR